MDIYVYLDIYLYIYLYIYDISEIPLGCWGDAAEDHDHQNRAVPADGRIAERHQGGGAVARERGEDLGHPGAAAESTDIHPDGWDILGWLNHILKKTVNSTKSLNRNKAKCIGSGVGEY